ncbi:MAG: protein kinase domain-containing protein [Planctomycetota bacterium]|jgi:tetratricopeptide (TPR) repeat protein
MEEGRNDESPPERPGPPDRLIPPTGASPDDDENAPQVPPTEANTIAGDPACLDAGGDETIDPSALPGGGGPATVAPTGAGAEGADGAPRKTLGAYWILEEIGRGGMGVVYRGYHPKLKREVALKVLIAGEDASEEAIARFHREAEAVAKLGHHPNIVPVYDIGQEGRLHYFAMHFVSGKPLDRLIDDGEVTPRRAATITRKVAMALEHAHAHGVLHRDVKPPNILISAAGEPQITDFGLAKDVQSDEKVTRSGTAMGSPNYMSPEQADGRIEAIDARTDVYGLGATFYEMLTLFPPFEGSSIVNILHQVLMTDPTPPRKRNPAVPRDLETICLKALEKDADRRYATAAEMAEDLRRFIENEPIAARPASMTYRLSKRVRRNPAAYLTGVIGSILLAAVGVFFLGVRPAMERASVLREDREALGLALERRFAPEREVERLLSAARERFDRKDFRNCAELCDEIDRRFGPLQARRFEAIPDVRNKGLIRAEFPGLLEPYSFPLPRAASLKARALAAGGGLEKARGAWARAYWRARQGRPAREGSEAEDGEVLRKSLLELGGSLLRDEEFRRAQGTFEEYLHRFPEPEGGPGTFGRARALQGLMEGPAALEAYRLALAGGRLDPPDVRYAEDAASLLEAILPVGNFQSPQPLKCKIGTVPVAFDLDGDGRDEMLWVFCLKSRGFRVLGLRFGEGEPKTVLDQDLPTLRDWRVGGASLLIRGGDLDDDGTKELLFYVSEIKTFHAEVAVYRWDGTAFRRTAALRDRCPNWPKALRYADLDGDGRDEILVGFHATREAIYAYRREGGSLQRVFSVDAPSFLYGLETEREPGGDRIVFSLGPYSLYRVFSARCDLGTGKVVLDPPGELFRCLASGFSPFQEGDGYAFVTGKMGLPSDWRVAMGDQEGDPGRLLEPGLYVLPGKAGAFEPPRLVLKDETLGARSGTTMNWGDGERRKFIAYDDSRLTIGPIAGNEQRWIRMTCPSRGGGMVQGQMDDDETPEVFLCLGDHTVMTLGLGEKETAETALRSREREEKGADPGLSIANSLAEMGLLEEAERVFEETARSPVAEIRGLALLGKADALAQGGELAKAVTAYGKAIAVSSARSRAFVGKAHVLKTMERWDELVRFLVRGLEDGNLPAGVAARMTSLLAKARPMADRKAILTFGGEAGIPEGAWVADPLAVHLEGGRLRFCGDAYRRVWILFPYLYTGEAFRIEIEGSVDQLDWAAFLHFGVPALEGYAEEGCLKTVTNYCPRRREFMAAFEPGDDTYHPALFAFLGSSGWTFGRHYVDAREEVFPYPPPLPLPFRLVLDYGPTLDTMKVLLTDPEGKVLYRREAEIELQLPNGPGFVGIRLGPGNIPGWGWGTYHCRLTLDRFTLLAPRTGTFNLFSKPPHAEETLALANGHLSGGRLARAVTMYGELLAAEEESGDCPVEMKDWPTVRARALLFRGTARFREGKPERGAEDVAEALREDPFPVLFLLQQDFLFLRPPERRFFAEIIRDSAFSGDAPWFGRFVEALEKKPRISEETRARWEATLAESGDRESVRLALLGEALHVILLKSDFVHEVFKGTSLENRLRAERLQDIRRLGEGKRGVFDVYARQRWTAYLKEHPEDVNALHDFANFLASCPRKTMRDPPRAVDLARRLEAVARSRGDSGIETIALEIQAAAHFAAGDAAKAVEAQEKAWWKCPKEETALKERIERKLEAYKAGAR